MHGQYSIINVFSLVISVPNQIRFTVNSSVAQYSLLMCKLLDPQQLVLFILKIDIFFSWSPITLHFKHINYCRKFSMSFALK